MSGVAALAKGIKLTDATVAKGLPRVKFVSKPQRKPESSPSPIVKDSGYQPPIKLSPQAKSVVDTISSFYPPAAIAAKFLTGAANDEWRAYVDTTLPALEGKTDSDFSPSEFGELVTKFVSLRASLARQGYPLPDVKIPVLIPKKGAPIWLYGLIALGLLGGVALAFVYKG